MIAALIIGVALFATWVVAVVCIPRAVEALASRGIIDFEDDDE